MATMTMENTIAELKTEIDTRELNAELELHAAEVNRNLSKLNKNDYLVVLGDKVTKTKVTPQKSKEEIAAEKEILQAEKIAEIEKQRADTAAHNNTKVMCIVTDHYTGMKLEDEEVVGRVYEQSWGNKMGSVTGRIVLNGEPQYLHIGTIRAAREVNLPKIGKNSAGKEAVSVNGGKRFTITIVDGWDQDRLDAEKAKQKLRI